MPKVIVPLIPLCQCQCSLDSHGSSPMAPLMDWRAGMKKHREFHWIFRSTGTQQRAKVKGQPGQRRRGRRSLGHCCCEDGPQKPAMEGGTDAPIITLPLESSRYCLRTSSGPLGLCGLGKAAERAFLWDPPRQSDWHRPDTVFPRSRHAKLVGAVPCFNSW